MCLPVFKCVSTLTAKMYAYYSLGTLGILLVTFYFYSFIVVAPTKLYLEDHVSDTEDAGGIQRTPFISIFILLIIFISSFISGQNVLFEKCSGGKFIHKTCSGHSPVLRYAASVVLRFSFI